MEKQMISKINKICSEIIRPVKMNKARWMGVGHSRRGQAGVRDFYFILLIFLMWAIFKVFIEFVTILLFFFFFFWLWGIWGLRSLARNWQASPALEGKVLTTGLPGKSWAILYCIESLGKPVLRRWQLSQDLRKVRESGKNLNDVKCFGQGERRSLCFWDRTWPFEFQEKQKDQHGWSRVSKWTSSRRWWGSGHKQSVRPYWAI